MIICVCNNIDEKEWHAIYSKIHALNAAKLLFCKNYLAKNKQCCRCCLKYIDSNYRDKSKS